MMTNSTPTTPTYRSDTMQLSQAIEMDPKIWGKGAEEIQLGNPINHGLHFKPPVEPLLLLLQAT